MHYANGREAKNGDMVMLMPRYGGSPVIGILYNAKAGNDNCNGQIAIVRPGDSCPNLAECLHIDDVKSAVIFSSLTNPERKGVTEVDKA